MASIESNLLMSGFWRATGHSGVPALSEYHLDWWNGFNKNFNEDLADATKDTSGMTVHQGGDYRVSTAYFSRGDGAVILPAEHNKYQDKAWHGKAPPRREDGLQRLYIRDVEWFTIGDNLERIELIKRRIMTEGAVGTCYASNARYLAKGNIHYQPISATGDPNHSVAIVGWDDNKIAVDDDAKKAPKPGAWLIKNSWGTNRGDQGYYWISYYDKHAARHVELGAVSFRNVEPLTYTDIYYHDNHGWRDTLTNVSQAFNAFSATGKQLIKAVSFFTTKHDVRYTVRLYSEFTNGRLDGELASKTGTIPFTGFHTINLDAPLLVQKGDKLYAYVELSDGGHAIDRTSIIPVLLDDQPQPPQPPVTGGQPPAGQTQPPAGQTQPPAGQPQPQQPGRRGGRGGGGGGGGGKPTVISKANPGESFYHDGGWKDLYDYKFADEKHNHTANFCIKVLAVSLEPKAAPAAIIAAEPVKEPGK
jgi:Lectin like domain/Papain family cysteine protease